MCLQSGSQWHLDSLLWHFSTDQIEQQGGLALSCQYWHCVLCSWQINVVNVHWTIFFCIAQSFIYGKMSLRARLLKSVGPRLVFHLCHSQTDLSCLTHWFCQRGAPKTSLLSCSGTPGRTHPQTSCSGSVAPAHSVVIPGLLLSMRKALAKRSVAGVLWCPGRLDGLTPIGLSPTDH